MGINFRRLVGYFVMVTSALISVLRWSFLILERHRSFRRMTESLYLETNVWLSAQVGISS